MKLSGLINSARKGFAYFTVIWISMIIAVIIAASLKMVSSQNSMTMRSQSWNSAIAVIEAGVEDALSHLYAHGTTNLACDGWSLTSDGYTIQRSLGESYYIVSISLDPNPNRPTIISQGFVPLPLTVASASSPFVLAAAGVITEGGKTYVSRAVRVTTERNGTFTKGLVTKNNINMNGNDVETDSFDSGDPLFSTLGQYDPLKANDNGDVATNSSITNSFSVGNANIKGRVATGPKGTVSLGSSGAVGSKTWHALGNNGIEPGYFTDDMNVSFPDVVEPFTGGAFTPSGGTVDGESYTYVLQDGNYEMSSMNMSGHNDLIVTGHAVLYVTGNVNLSGQAFINIRPGASLKLYVKGANASLSGQGVVNNGGNATNFFYYGLPSNKSLSISGNATFTGVVYAPRTALSLSGAGSGEADFTGASVTESATLEGDFKFHYDEALGRFGPRRPVVITSWNEI